MKTTTAYAQEFPTYTGMPAEITALVASGRLSDESWHHDACPSFCRTEDAAKGIEEKRTLWVDWERTEDRSDPSARRFLIQYPMSEPGSGFSTFETVEEAIKALFEA